MIFPDLCSPISSEHFWGYCYYDCDLSEKLQPWPLEGTVSQGVHLCECEWVLVCVRGYCIGTFECVDQECSQDPSVWSMGDSQVRVVTSGAGATPTRYVVTTWLGPGPLAILVLGQLLTGLSSSP